MNRQSIPPPETSRRHRLLPQISFRMAMSITAAVACFFALARVAESGAVFAVALLAMLGFVCVLFGLCAAFFCIAWVIANLAPGNGIDTAAQGSPFAVDQLPPQQLPPQDPVL